MTKQAMALALILSACTGSDDSTEDCDAVQAVAVEPAQFCTIDLGGLDYLQAEVIGTRILYTVECESSPTFREKQPVNEVLDRWTVNVCVRGNTIGRAVQLNGGGCAWVECE